jgi:translation initiation factor IF-3
VISRSVKDKNGREGSTAHKYQVNELIKADKIMVIDADGENVGVLSKQQAIMKAYDAGLDLVQVGEKDAVVIAKIMDFGKFLYEKKKQTSESKKHQKIIQIKEIKIRPNIGEQDYLTKLNHAAQFFADDKKVKFTLQFKGREIAMMEDLGSKLFMRISKDLASRDIGTLVEEKDNRAGAFWSKIYYVRR